jgi:hypothetical protein
MVVKSPVPSCLMCQVTEFSNEQNKQIEQRKNSLIFMKPPESFTGDVAHRRIPLLKLRILVGLQLV